MELSKSLGAIKQLIGEGKIEEAYTQLVQLLDAAAHFAELADIARINQADLYQLKAQTLKGTISSEDARLATNQLSEKALQLVRQIESGKTSFEDDVKPGSSKAWRYSLIGGIVALAGAFLVWQLVFRKDDAEGGCPSYSPASELRVMILPFKQTGSAKAIKPEFDIMDNLDDLIEKTPGLRAKAQVDVNEKYDIDKDYPNSARAVDIARNCDAQMLVWGKVNQSADGKDYTLDVRYRLLDAGGVRYAGDTTISRLLTVTAEAGWTSDAKAISRLLYLVLANQMRVQIAANILEELAPSALKGGADAPAPDTATSLVLADYYIRKNEPDSAIAHYDQVLAIDPTNSTALLKRGALLLEKKEYSAAARDLEAVPEASQNTTPVLREARIKAYLKSGQPDKAQHEVESAGQESGADNSSLQETAREVQDSLVALQERRDQMERQAASRPKDLNARLGAAKANLGLGETDKALKLANEVLKKNPENIKAVEVAAEAHLQKGDTAGAIKTIEAAERAGVNVKSIKLAPVIRPQLKEKPQ